MGYNNVEVVLFFFALEHGIWFFKAFMSVLIKGADKDRIFKETVAR